MREDPGIMTLSTRQPEDASGPKAVAPPVEAVAGDNQSVGDDTYTARAWDWVCWTGAKTFDGLDFAGEVLANFLGLTQSQYQWVIDIQEREKQEKNQRKLEARQRRQLRLEQLLEEEKRKLEELERGGARAQNEAAA